MSQETATIDDLMGRVYDELHSLAAACLSDERRDHTLVPTTLVHEAYLRLVQRSTISWNGKQHFFLTAARTIRRVLVDHARARQARKRGPGERRLTVSGLESPVGRDQVDVIDLEDALEELTRFHARMGRVVELRYFAGLTIDQTADALGVCTTTVEDDWAFARSWLKRRLDQAPRSPGRPR